MISARDLTRRQESLCTVSVQSVAGLTLIAIGLAVLFVATGTLWRSYSSTLVIREDHQLVTHGIYQFVRHPIYLGAIMICIGMPVYASSLYGLVAMVTLIPLFLCRIRIEERMLIDEYGSRYRTYQEATSKLIPFIY
jgi:protein-S-isoprenylcysteine O-methyltransferase Ste14